MLLNGSELDAQFYTCSYSNNVEPGNATVNVTFQGLCSGSASTTFVILNERASGTWGTCPWEISADGVLTVHPGTGESVYGADDAPWKSYVGDITSVVFAEGVVAPASIDGLLSGIYQATSIDVSGLDTSAVTSMRSLFDGCFAVETLDASSWNTANVTDMTRLFYGCSNLVSLNVSGWNTSNVTNMDSLFSGCVYLASIGVSRWNTSSVTNMQHMFDYCITASSLDLSGWDTSNVTNTDGMFRCCFKLETIYVGEGWSTESVTSSVEMFIDCTLLVGGRDTPYDSTHIDAEYARVDAIGAPGYLTAVTPPPSKIDINDATVTGVNGSYVFAGDSDGIEPVPVVTYQGRTLVEGVDYEVAYLDNVYAGRTYGEGHSAFVVISGKGQFGEGDFSGFKYVEFFIEPAQASSVTVAEIPEQTCTGSPITPDVTVTIGEMTLEKGRDYTVSYTNNVEPGVATATITGTDTGNLTGSTTVEFEITESMDNVLYGLVEVDGEEVESTYELRYGNSNAPAFEGITFHVHNYYEDSPYDFNVLDPIIDACYEASGLSGLRSNNIVERLWLEDANGNEIDVNSADIGNVRVQMVTNIGGDNDPNRMAIVHYDRETGIAAKLDIVNIEENGPYTDPETGDQYSLFVITYEGTLVDVMGDVALVCTNDWIEYWDASGRPRPFYQLSLDTDEHASVFLPAYGLIDGETYDHAENGDPRFTYHVSGTAEQLIFDPTRDIIFYVPVELGYVLDSVTYSVGGSDPVALQPSGSVFTDVDRVEYDLFRIPAAEDVIAISTTAHKGYTVNDNGTATFEEGTGLPSTAYKLSLDLSDGANVIAEYTHSSPSSRAALAVENASGDVDYYLWPDMPTYVTPYPSNEYRLVGGPTFTPSGAAITLTDEYGGFMVSLTAPATMRVEAALLDYVNAGEDPSTGVTVDVPEDIVERYEELTLVVEPETEADAIEAAKIVIAEGTGDGFSPDELVMYDIHYEDASGEEVVAPTDESGDVMRVTLPVPDGWKASQTRVYYIAADTDPIDMNATPTVDGTSVVFYTSHFSDYAMALDMDAVPVKTDLSTAVIAPIPDQTYAGEPVELKPGEIIVTLGGLELTAQVDYTVTYENNREPGTATVIVEGAGNFGGMTTATFRIVEPAPPSSPFRDVYAPGPGGIGGTPHYGDIIWLASAGVSTGWIEPDGTRTFRPTAGVQRADMAAFLYRLAGSPEYYPTDAEMLRFVDVNASTPHAREIWWLAAAGISTGWVRSDGAYEFRPSSTVVRQDMAAFLFRLARLGGLVSDSWQPTEAQRRAFSDINDLTPHAREVFWLASSGVSTGWDMGGHFEFRGMSTIIRQDMAAFLRRLDGLGLYVDPYSIDYSRAMDGMVIISRGEDAVTYHRITGCRTTEKPGFHGVVVSIEYAESINRRPCLNCYH